MRSALETEVVDSVLNACNLDLESDAVMDASPQIFDLLTNSENKRRIVKLNLGRAKQLDEQGERRRAVPYYKRTCQLGLKLFEQHPDTVEHVLTVNRSRNAAESLGGPFVAEYGAGLQRLIDTQRPSIATWVANYYLGYLSTRHRGLSADPKAHFEAMLAQLDDDFMVAAVNEADPQERSEIEMLIGHACLATGDYARAKLQYGYVVDSTSGSQNTDSGIAGLYIAYAESWEAAQDPAVGIAAFESFLASDKKGPEHTAEALFELSRLYERTGNHTASRRKLDQIVQEYPDTKAAGRAQKRIRQLEPPPMPQHPIPPEYVEVP